MPWWCSTNHKHSIISLPKVCHQKNLNIKKGLHLGSFLLPTWTGVLDQWERRCTMIRIRSDRKNLDTWPRYNWLWFYRSQKLFFCLSLYQSFILFIPKEKLVYIPINRDVGPVVINVINYICCKSNKILQTWKSWIYVLVNGDGGPVVQI